MGRAAEDANRRLLRARDAMDRAYAEPLDIPALARIAHVSGAHLIRQFRGAFGETPHRYLQRRRVERAMFLLRATDRPVTEICLDVGLEVTADVDMGVMRWLTVGVPGQRGREILLERPGPPAHDDATAAQVRELVTTSRPMTAAGPTAS